MTAIDGISPSADLTSYGETSSAYSTTTSSNSIDQQIQQLMALVEELMIAMSGSNMPSLSSLQSDSSHVNPPSMNDFMNGLSNELNAVCARMGGTSGGPIPSMSSGPVNISLLETPLSEGAQAVRFGLGGS